MRLELDSTGKIVGIEVGGQTVPARVWAGKTGAGVPVIAFIACVRAERASDTSELERELVELAAPDVALEAIPFRMVWP